MAARALERLLFLLLLGLAAIAGAEAAPAQRSRSFQLPALQEPATREYHRGKVIWVDLVTPDLKGAEQFYGALLGWTFEEVPGTRLPYHIALDEGQPIAGFVQPRPPRSGRRQPAWLPYFSVPDVERVRREATALGARVLSPPRTYPQRGTQAVLSDPQGAVFGVLQSSSGDPPDELADPGQWIWASVLTREPKAAAIFYQRLFGYEIEQLPSQDASSHWLMSSEGFARASSNQLQRAPTRDHPYWLNFVRVTDTTASSAKAKELGGTVLTEPHLDRHGGKVAVVADPAGTPFGLLEWPEENGPDQEEAPK